MNWRMKLANWISGGELSRSYKKYSVLESRHEYICALNRDHMLAWADRRQRSAELSAAFREIAAMETDKANATVRRMAAKAREALTPPSTP